MVMKLEEGVVHIEVVADSVRTSTKSGPHTIHAGMFKAKHFLSQPVFTVLGNSVGRGTTVMNKNS